MHNGTPFSIMTPNIPDHYLWLGLGVFTFFAIQHVSHGLNHILTLTAIHNPTPPLPASILPPNPTHQEDSIHPSSLLTLATSHNTELRASATRILATRFYAHKGARRALLRDLSSGDEEVVRRARLALNMLRELGVWKTGRVARTEGWRVVGSVPREGQDRGLGFGRGEETEMETRRRRREAVVIHDGDGMMSVEDFWARPAGAPEGDAEGREREREEFESFIAGLGIGPRE
ncbi:hypothetical protein NX059_003802 [Plenodomus lindquistii]|nr:hypothetical protein NX059_003802 [Plenodomus lindquistii]